MCWNLTLEIVNHSQNLNIFFSFCAFHLITTDSGKILRAMRLNFHMKKHFTHCSIVGIFSLNLSSISQTKVIRVKITWVIMEKFSSIFKSGEFLKWSSKREREKNNNILCLEHQKIPRKVVQHFHFFILLILNKF